MVFDCYFQGSSMQGHDAEVIQAACDTRLVPEFSVEVHALLKPAISLQEGIRVSPMPVKLSDVLFHRRDARQVCRFVVEGEGALEIGLCFGGAPLIPSDLADTRQCVADIRTGFGDSSMAMRRPIRDFGLGEVSLDTEHVGERHVGGMQELRLIVVQKLQSLLIEFDGALMVICARGQIRGFSQMASSAGAGSAFEESIGDRELPGHGLRGFGSDHPLRCKAREPGAALGSERLQKRVALCGCHEAVLLFAEKRGSRCRPDHVHVGQHANARFQTCGDRAVEVILPGTLIVRVGAKYREDAPLPESWAEGRGGIQRVAFRSVEVLDAFFSDLRESRGEGAGGEPCGVEAPAAIGDGTENRPLNEKA